MGILHDESYYNNNIIIIIYYNIIVIVIAIIIIVLKTKIIIEGECYKRGVFYCFVDDEQLLLVKNLIENISPR